MQSLLNFNYIGNRYSLKVNVENYFAPIFSNQCGYMLPQQYTKTFKIYNTGIVSVESLCCTPETNIFYINYI